MLSHDADQQNYHGALFQQAFEGCHLGLHLLAQRAYHSGANSRLMLPISAVPISVKCVPPFSAFITCQPKIGNADSVASQTKRLFGSNRVIVATVTYGGRENRFLPW